MGVETLQRKHTRTIQAALPQILLVCSIIGLAAAFSLTYDKIQILHNAAYNPSCNLSPILSCESVMKTSQASLFGIPNSMFGIVLFSMLFTFSLVLLAGATLKRWFWIMAELAALVGVAFMHYLFFESAFRIHTICPWCFGVWMITILAFWAITVRNFREGVFGDRHSKRVEMIIKWCTEKYSNDLLILWYVVILGILLVKFWYYWKTLL